jgi:hypothetical protein
VCEEVKSARQRQLCAGALCVRDCNRENDEKFAAFFAQHSVNYLCVSPEIVKSGWEIDAARCARSNKLHFYTRKVWISEHRERQPFISDLKLNFMKETGKICTSLNNGVFVIMFLFSLWKVA